MEETERIGGGYREGRRIDTRRGVRGDRYKERRQRG